MISFEDFIKQDDEGKYNNMQHDLLEIERLKEDNEYLNKANIELSTEKNKLNNIINNDDVYGYIKHLEDLITKKDTIINEFMEELKWQRKVSLSLNESFTVSRIDILINKLQELKGEDKDITKKSDCNYGKVEKENK